MVLNILFAAAGIACLVYYFALGFFIRFGQSLTWLWPVFSAVFLLRHVAVARIHRGLAPLLPRFLVHIVHGGFILFLVSFIVIVCIIMNTGFVTAEPGLDYVIVLGAKVNGTKPGGALRNRIQVAYEYWQESPNTILVASGGQGPDEGISEAQCIRDGLIARGVPEESILMEDKSTSTYENIHNTLALIDHNENTGIGIVTNNFHIYRALKIARQAGGADYHGVYVYTSYLSFPHYILREYCAVCVGLLTGRW